MRHIVVRCLSTSQSDDREAVYRCAETCVPDARQANFNGDALDDLVLPLVAYQIKTAVNALHTVNEQKGLVRGLGFALQPLPAVFLFGNEMALGADEGEDKVKCCDICHVFR